MVGDLRAITEAYPQAHDKLARFILASVPQELQNMYPQDRDSQSCRSWCGRQANRHGCHLVLDPKGVGHPLHAGNQNGGLTFDTGRELVLVISGSLSIP